VNTIGDQMFDCGLFGGPIVTWQHQDRRSSVDIRARCPSVTSCAVPGEAAVRVLGELEVCLLARF
jgi:hypothetical protein